MQQKLLQVPNISEDSGAISFLSLAATMASRIKGVYCDLLSIQHIQDISIAIAMLTESMMNDQVFLWPGRHPALGEEPKPVVCYDFVSVILIRRGDHGQGNRTETAPVNQSKLDYAFHGRVPGHAVSMKQLAAALLATLILFSLSCKTQLRGPSGAPDFELSGLYTQRDGDTWRILSIACGGIRHSVDPDQTQCLFLHQVRVPRDLTFSGKRFEITERWGVIDTDPDEALFTRTVFVRYHQEIKDGDAWKVENFSRPQVDRELKGDDVFLLLRFEEGCLRDDEGCWNRVPGNLTLQDSRSSPDTDSDDIQLIFQQFSGQKGLAFSPALEFFLRNGMARSGQKFQLKNDRCSLQASTTRFGAGFIVLDSAPEAKCGTQFTVIPETKQNWNLAELYSLRAGLGTPMKTDDQKELTEKEKRREEIRERIRRGEEVSQEELLEVLEN